MYRQGDLLFVPETENDARWKPTLRARNSGLVLTGEVTGHAHRFASNATVMETDDGEPFEVQVGIGGADLNHEEHATIRIPEGTYRVIRQREFDGEQARYVFD